MTDNDKFAIAARLYVQLRRKSNRAIDTVWMVQSNEYAREVLRIARAQSDNDLQQLANHFEALMGPAAAPSASASAPVSASKYVGSLR
ncbi:MAG: hypothetical protein ABW049_07620 [Spongiibacteraceae bacterium]